MSSMRELGVEPEDSGDTAPFEPMTGVVLFKLEIPLFVTGVIVFDAELIARFVIDPISDPLRPCPVGV